MGARSHMRASVARARAAARARFPERARATARAPPRRRGATRVRACALSSRRRRGRRVRGALLLSPARARHAARAVRERRRGCPWRGGMSEGGGGSVAGGRVGGVWAACGRRCHTEPWRHTNRACHFDTAPALCHRSESCSQCGPCVISTACDHVAPRAPDGGHRRAQDAAGTTERAGDATDAPNGACGGWRHGERCPVLTTRAPPISPAPAHGRKDDSMIPIGSTTALVCEVCRARTPGAWTLASTYLPNDSCRARRALRRHPTH